MSATKYDLVTAFSTKGDTVFIPIRWYIDAVDYDLAVYIVPDNGEPFFSNAYSWIEQAREIKVENKWGAGSFHVYVTRKENAAMLAKMVESGEFDLTAILAQFQKNVRILEQLQESNEHELHAPDKFTRLLPDKDGRRNRILTFDDEGQPSTVILSEQIANADKYYKRVQELLEETKEVKDEAIRETERIKDEAIAETERIKAEAISETEAVKTAAIEETGRIRDQAKEFKEGAEKAADASQHFAEAAGETLVSISGVAENVSGIKLEIEKQLTEIRKTEATALAAIDKIIETAAVIAGNMNIATAAAERCEEIKQELENLRTDFISICEQAKKDIQKLWDDAKADLSSLTEAKKKELNTLAENIRKEFGQLKNEYIELHDQFIEVLHFEQNKTLEQVGTEREGALTAIKNQFEDAKTKLGEYADELKNSLDGKNTDILNNISSAEYGALQNIDSSKQNAEIALEQKAYQLGQQLDDEHNIETLLDVERARIADLEVSRLRTGVVHLAGGAILAPPTILPDEIQVGSAVSVMFTYAKSTPWQEGENFCILTNTDPSTYGFSLTFRHLDQETGKDTIEFRYIRQSDGQLYEYKATSSEPYFIADGRPHCFMLTLNRRKENATTLWINVDDVTSYGASPTVIIPNEFKRQYRLFVKDEFSEEGTPHFDSISRIKVFNFDFLFDKLAPYTKPDYMAGRNEPPQVLQNARHVYIDAEKFPVESKFNPTPLKPGKWGMFDRDYYKITYTPEGEMVFTITDKINTSAYIKSGIPKISYAFEKPTASRGTISVNLELGECNPAGAYAMLRVEFTDGTHRYFQENAVLDFFKPIHRVSIAFYRQASGSGNWQEGEYITIKSLKFEIYGSLCSYDEKAAGHLLKDLSPNGNHALLIDGAYSDKDAGDVFFMEETLVWTAPGEKGFISTNKKVIPDYSIVSVFITVDTMQGGEGLEIRNDSGFFTQLLSSTDEYDMVGQYINKIDGQLYFFTTSHNTKIKVMLKIERLTK